MTKALISGDPGTAASVLEECATDADLYESLFTQALQAIVAGSRDRSLADADDLNYTMAAEILFLIETLEKNPS